MRCFTEYMWVDHKEKPRKKEKKKMIGGWIFIQKSEKQKRE